MRAGGPIAAGLALALTGPSLAACAHGPGPDAAVIVFERPPAPRDEPPPPAPSPDAVWAEGHWTWDGRAGFEWREGRWLTPRPGHVYAQAHWERRGRGWVYVPGRFVPVEE